MSVVRLPTLDELPRTPASNVKKLGWRGVMREVDRTGSMVVTHHDRPEAVILSLDEYRALVLGLRRRCARRARRSIRCATTSTSAWPRWPRPMRVNACATCSAKAPRWAARCAQARATEGALWRWRARQIQRRVRAQ